MKIISLYKNGSFFEGFGEDQKEGKYLSFYTEGSNVRCTAATTWTTTKIMNILPMSSEKFEPTAFFLRKLIKTETLTIDAVQEVWEDLHNHIRRTSEHSLG